MNVFFSKPLTSKYSTGDYSRILSPPESFLEIARSVVQDKPSNDASAATPQSPNIPPNPKVRAEQPRDETENNAKEIPLHGASSEQQPVSLFNEPSTPKAQVKPASVEPKEELLLDFGTTPPDPSPLREKALQSPAIEDLKGIEFEHYTNANSPAKTLHERSNSEQQTESKKDGSNKEAVVSSKKISRSDYEREIFLLGVFLESTTLGEEYCDQFKKIKAELEERLRNYNTQETTTEATQKLSIDDKTSATDTESNTPADTFKPTPAVLSKDENTPTKQIGNTSMLTTQNSTGSQRLRQAINAPPFHPRSSSFTGYRSPINSTSSDSTPPPTPVPPRPNAIPIKRPSLVPAEPESPAQHIFGNHLLPGRRSRAASALQSTEGKPS